ncbi:protein of unknown function [Kyrpidia spormannii]|uniref:Uncharacterized protein n=1 Tax=Kyrpidia spormannii TaxID=2055160 RepID=A0ACA8ZDR6_9BACL|nr:protein of unknown function [Kyrpidia spormannii]
MVVQKLDPGHGSGTGLFHFGGNDHLAGIKWHGVVLYRMAIANAVRQHPSRIAGQQEQLPGD